MDREKQIIFKKLGENGLVINGTILMGMLFSNQEVGLVPIGVVTSLLAGSCYLLYKGKSPYTKIKQQQKQEDQDKQVKIYKKKPYKYRKFLD